MADSPYSDVNVSAHHATAYFPSVADELNSLMAWHSRAQDNLNAAGRLDGETLIRMSNLAKVSPHLGPSVTPLALAGYGPDHPVSQWAMEQSARMHHATGGNLGNMGTIVAPWRLKRGSPQTRVRNALNALNSAGLVDDDGVLHEPNMDSGAPRYLWEQFTDAATSAEGQDIPYVNRHGEPSNVSLLGNAISRTTDSLAMARNMESRDYAGVRLRAQGFLPLADMIQPLMMAPDQNRVSLPASILQEAEDVGLLTPDGYLMEYRGQSAPRGEQGDPDYEVYNRIYRAFKEANIDLPFISDRAGPTVIRNSEGGHWETLQPQPEPEDAQGGGILANWSEATQRPAVGSSVVPSLGGAQDVFRQGVQVAGMAFNAPRQEVTGLVRNAYGGLTGEQFKGGFQSDLAVWLEGGGQGELGSGYMVDPDSAVAMERHRREATRGQIAGQNLTTGRIFANTLLEPGTTPYNVVSGLVDAGEAMFLDPVDRALAAGTRIGVARRTFAPGPVERAGGIRGLFDFVEQPTAQTWLDGPVGTAVVDDIAATTSPVEIWRRTGRRLDPSFTARLADTVDPTEVRQVLSPLLGTAFRRTDEVWRRPHFGVPRFSSGALRFMGMGVPDHVMDTYDLNNVVTNLERFGRIAGMDSDRLDRYLNLASRSQSRAEVFEVTRGMMRESDGLLASAGMTNDSARRNLTALFTDSHEGARKWFVDEVGSEVPVWSDVVVDGDPLQTGLGPHLVTELLTRNIELPDFRQVRRVMSSKPMRFLTTKHSVWDTGQMTGEQRIPISLMEWTQTQLWKPIVLARIAWPIRVIGEEQVRMAAHGRANMFSHPISYISWRTRKGQVDALGEPLAEATEHAQAMSRVRGGFLDDDPNRVRTGGWTVYSRNPDNEAEYIAGWAGELSLLASDPIARQVARAGGREVDTGVDTELMDALVAHAPEVRPADEAYTDPQIETSPEDLGLTRGEPPRTVHAGLDQTYADGTPPYSEEWLNVRSVAAHHDVNPEFIRSLIDEPEAAAEARRATFSPSPLLRDQEEGLPIVLRLPDGKLYFAEGTHRGIAQAAQRRGKFQARVLDVTEEGRPRPEVPPQAGATPSLDDLLDEDGGWRVPAGRDSTADRAARAEAAIDALPAATEVRAAAAARQRFIRADADLADAASDEIAALTAARNTAAEASVAADEAAEQALAAHPAPFTPSPGPGPLSPPAPAPADVLDEVSIWLREGQGRPFLDELIASSPAGRQLERPDVLRNYLATVQDRIRIKTGGDSDLLDMVRTGRLGDIGVFDVEGLKHTPDFTRALRAYWDIGPDAVKGQVMVHVSPRNDQANRVMDGWNNAVDWAFGHLMSRRTNNLSRSPNFRQAYWARMEEMAGFADNVDDLEAAAAAAGMNAKDFRRAAFRNRAAPEDRLDLENMDTVAKGYALDDTKALLYDLSDRGAVADAMRLVAPFGDAWQEVLGRWFGVKALGGQQTGLLWQNPRVIRKGQQIIEGAQDSGFFYQDENTGEHMFTYPGSEFMTKHLLGVPIPLTGRAEGLSFMTQIVPGLGPAAQVPVAALLSNRPNMQWIREQLIPFGAPNEEGDFSPALDLLTYMPPWVKRAYTAITDGGFDAESNRQYANSQMRVAQYLSSTGDYNLEDPADFQRMMEDAGNKARWFYLIRSLAGYVAPSAPAPRWLMETSQGNMAIVALAEEHHRLQEANFETADAEFLSRFGDDAVLAMTPMSKSVSWGLVATRDAYDWALEHPNLQSDYPSIYGLFGPQQSTPNDFDYGAYLAQFQSGERESLSPDEWMRMSQHMLATRIYRRAQRQVGANPTDEDSEWLANGRAWLREAYPGYDNLLGVPTGPNVESAMQELRGIINEDGVRGTPVARAVQTYLTERDWAEQEAQARGFRGFANAEDTRDLRDYLRSGAMELSQEVPAFRRVFDYVLSRELDRTEDEDIEVAANA